MKEQTRKTRAGFTLIELLIVIAIIAILALIAIPNFLEAQTRSKVARVHADLRTIRIGLESYFVDYNSYPTDTGTNEQGTYTRLTTPLAYLSSIPQDILADPSSYNPPNPQFKAFIYADVNYNPAVFSAQGVGYLMVSSGPNMRKDLNDAQPGPYGTVYKDNIGYGPKAVCNWLYDPTNGTISYGDIYVTNKEFYN